MKIDTEGVECSGYWEVNERYHYVKKGDSAKFGSVYIILFAVENQQIICQG